MLGNFEEKAFYSAFVKSVVAVGLVVLIAVLFFSFDWIPDQLSEVKAITVIGLLAAIVSLALFFTMRFGARGKNLYARLGPLSFKVDKKDIELVEALPRLPPWGGWGVRVWWYRGGLALAFVSHHKQALLIRKKSGLFKRIVLSVENPKDFARKAGLKLLPRK